MKKEAIIDNNVLVNLFSTDLLHILASCFSRIYIPTEIKNEFEKVPEINRQNFIHRINSDYGFYRLCDTFDPIILNFVVNKIHKGESEAIAQSYKRRIPIFLTDDSDCIDFIKKNVLNIKCYTTLTVLALADITGFISNQKEVVNKLYKIHKFKSCDLRDSYNFAYTELGVYLNKKLISKKTSLKYILN